MSKPCKHTRGFTRPQIVQSRLIVASEALLCFSRGQKQHWLHSRGAGCNKRTSNHPVCFSALKKDDTKQTKTNAVQTRCRWISLIINAVFETVCKGLDIWHILILSEKLVLVALSSLRRQSTDNFQLFLFSPHFFSKCSKFSCLLTFEWLSGITYLFTRGPVMFLIVKLGNSWCETICFS